MLSHKIIEDVYYIQNDSGEVILTVKLEDMDQIKISTSKEVYAGPVDFIHFKEE